MNAEIPQLDFQHPPIASQIPRVTLHVQLFAASMDPPLVIQNLLTQVRVNPKTAMPKVTGSWLRLRVSAKQDKVLAQAAWATI